MAGNYRHGLRKERKMAEDNKYITIKKYVFPAGECGGEIRINIPVFASKEDVQSAMMAMQMIADNWKEKN